MEGKYLNCTDIYNPDHDKQPKIVIIWAGGIWCGTTFALAQMGFKDITVVDFDEVELKNTSSQLYKESDIGLPKVVALANNVKEFTGIEIKRDQNKFKPDHVKDADLVILAVDQMSVRKEIVESITEKTIRYLDCRMAAMAFEIHMFVPVYENILYFNTWYSDEDASPVTCTSKSTSFNTFCIAGIITRLVIGIIKDDPFIMKKRNIQVDLANLIIS